MSKVELLSRMNVIYKDLVTLEGQARGALSVLSNLEPVSVCSPKCNLGLTASLSFSYHSNV